jgi:hypothetical protein
MTATDIPVKNMGTIKSLVHNSSKTQHTLGFFDWASRPGLIQLDSTFCILGSTIYITLFKIWHVFAGKEFN